MICDHKQHSIKTSPGNVKENIHLKPFDEEFVSSKERLYDIISFLPDATFVIDSASRVIAWNQAMEELTQVKAEEMLGKNKYEYFFSLHKSSTRLFSTRSWISSSKSLSSWAGEKLC